MINMNVIANFDTGDSPHCPHCGAAALPEGDENPGAARVRHLLHHIRREALCLEDYGEGEFYLGDHCEPESATTWPRAAGQVRVCLVGTIGDHYEAMCGIAVQLMKLGKLGTRPADWSVERAALSWTKNRMYRWLDDHYPCALELACDSRNAE